jgi:dTMP kinase
MKGKLIVIEGLDGSGKATQAKRLAAALQQRGERVREISFPNYDSDSSALVKMYLSGAFGTQPGDVNAYAASSFYAVDRYAGMKQDWGDFDDAGGILIADRYTTSNAVHQCCKLPREFWDRYLDWLFDYEYRLLGLPAPDLVVYLRLGIETSQRLMSERYHGDEKKKDIHESNTSYLNQAHLAADYCAGKYAWKTVECAENGSLRSIDEIGADVWNLLPRVLEL